MTILFGQKNMMKKGKRFNNYRGIKYLFSILFFVNFANPSFSQKNNVSDAERLVAGKWRDLADSNHIIVFTSAGVYSEYPVKMTITSKNDTMKGEFRIEQRQLGYFSVADSVGTGYVMSFYPIYNNSKIEFQRRIILFDNTYLEVATWKGGPYLFRRKK